MRNPPKSCSAAIASTALPTRACVLLFQNLFGGEKRIEQQLPKPYETDDAEFRRSLSARPPASRSTCCWTGSAA